MSGYDPALPYVLQFYSFQIQDADYKRQPLISAPRVLPGGTHFRPDALLPGHS